MIEGLGAFSDFAGRPLNIAAYNDRPFTFLDHAAQKDLANISAINLIENGDRAARENWQNKQLTNLLRHAHTASKFWRRRMPSRMINHGVLKYLPVQTREDLVAHVTLEAPLNGGDGDAANTTYASTGSTGTPVKVHLSKENGYYNLIRSLAQYFIYDLGLEHNRVKIAPGTKLEAMKKKSIIVERSESWAGPLSRVFRNGSQKFIMHYHDDAGLAEELSKERVGYLVCPSRFIYVLMNIGGIELIERLGIKLWLHLSDYRDPELVDALKSICVPSLSNYSAGEIGPIAFECAKHEGHFHVAHTNVIVECDDQVSASVNGTTVGRLLITHLHSYATPVVRYDIGDFGQVESRCLCGHDGPTICNIFGRGKHFLRHPNGRLLPFYLSTRVLLEAAHFKECRIRQFKPETITVELGGRENLALEEETRLKELIVRTTDPAFQIEIKPVKEIDWEPNSKRLLFSSAVA